MGYNKPQRNNFWQRLTLRKKAILGLLAILIISSGLIFWQTIANRTGRADILSPNAVSLDKGYKINLTESAKQINLNFSLQPLKQEEIEQNGTNYQKLSIIGSDFYSEEQGAPQIPIIKEKIQIPDNATNIKITSLPKDQPQVSANILVYPVPKQVEKEKDGYQYIEEEFFFDQKKYNQDKLLPEKLANVSQDGYFRSIRMLELNVLPVQYNAAKKQLNFNQEVSVQVSFDLQKNKKALKNTEKGFEKVSKKMMINYKESKVKDNKKLNLSLKNAQAQTNGSVTNLTAQNLKNTSNQFDYLIITHSDFYNSQQLNDLANYRANYNHLNIAIAKVDDIYSQFPNAQGNDYSIQDFTRFAYDSWQTSPQYLMLVGGPQLVPSHQTLIDDYSAGHYYDNDKWFTFVSGSDLIPDYAVGRLQVTNVYDINNIKDKIISYEQGPIVAGDYHDKTLYVQGTARGDLWMISQIENLGLDLQKILKEEGKTTQDLINAINSGKNFLYWIGHGTPTYWDFTLSNSNINLFNFYNFNKYPLIFTMSCSTADLDYESIGSVFVKAKNIGAVAYYGATNVVSALDNRPDIILKAIFEGFEYDLGKAVILGEYLPDGAQKYILLGDPALQAFGYKLNQQKPDLTLAPGNISYDPLSQEIKLKITNLGLSPSTNTIARVTIHDLEGNPIHSQDLSIGPILANSSQEVSQKVSDPTKVGLGRLGLDRQKFLVVIDPDNTIDESFELNNQNCNSLDTVTPSSVTLLSGNQGVGGAMVSAYNTSNQRIAFGLTNSIGQVSLRIYHNKEFYLKIGDDFKTETQIAPFNQSVNLTISNFSFNLAAGWNMISLPASPINPSPREVFKDQNSNPISIDGRLVRYSHDDLAYIPYYSIGFDDEFGNAKRGDGYWLTLDQPTTMVYQGYLSSQPKEIPLKTKGWYMIGGATSDISIASSNWQIRNNSTGQTKPFADAFWNWISDPLNAYSNTDKSYITVGIDEGIDQESNLKPWAGYWLCTREDNLTLIMP